MDFPFHPFLPFSNVLGLSTLIIAPAYLPEQGFDEFMNVVLDDAEEVYSEKSGKEVKARRELGEWNSPPFVLYSPRCPAPTGEWSDIDRV